MEAEHVRIVTGLPSSSLPNTKYLYSETDLVSLAYKWDQKETSGFFSQYTKRLYTQIFT